MKRTAIESLLPGIIRRTLVPGDPGSGLLDVMEQLHAPSEAVLDSLATSFDPRRTRAEFVPLLARWVNLDRILDDGSRRSAIRIEPGRIRELTAIAARLSRWRGTCRGLLLFLETATGTRGFAIDEQVPARNGAIRPFHIRVRAPETTREHQALITRIIEVEKPAYVTYELVFEGAAGPATAASEEKSAEKQKSTEKQAEK